ncbi:MAG: histidine phosphatase family protein [Actinomycetota bacterium]|nr:histidine phosphatase family protein [Actinomycetota bacterium]
MRVLELRRHAPRDPDEDRLSQEGQALAQETGRNLPGGYVAMWSSTATRAAETVAWFLRGLGQQLPQEHGAIAGLASEDAAETVRRLLESLPDGGRGLAVGHTPLIETAVGTLTGTPIEPLRECEGVAIEQDDGGSIRVAAEYRREA